MGENICQKLETKMGSRIHSVQQEKLMNRETQKLLTRTYVRKHAHAHARTHTRAHKTAKDIYVPVRAYE